MTPAAGQRTPVVVGHDGSTLGRAYLAWAAGWAAQAGADLLVARAIDPHERHTDDDVRAELLRDIAATAHDNPHLHVGVRVTHGNAAAALAGASRDAAAVVVGATGGEGGRRVALGATAETVAAHSRCPVVVLPPHPTVPGEQRDVVVGVDGSPEAVDAVTFAAVQAATWGGSVTAVHVRYPTPVACLADQGAAGTPDVLETQLYRDDAAQLWSPVDEVHSAAAPATPLVRRIVDGDPASALAAAAAGAGMLVVADRGIGGFAGLRVGSVTRNLLHDLPCPVVVARSGADHPSVVAASTPARTAWSRPSERRSTMNDSLTTTDVIDESPRVEIRRGGGLDDRDQPLVGETMARLVTRLERTGVTGIDTELSVKERGGRDMRTTLEVWVPGMPRLVATSADPDLAVALADVADRLATQLNETAARREPKNNRTRRDTIRPRPSDDDAEL